MPSRAPARRAPSRPGHGRPHPHRPRHEPSAERCREPAASAPQTLHPPAAEVSRAALVNRLRAGRSRRVASIVAPAGFGKTTLVEQWAARDERTFVRLTIDQADADPAVLLTRLFEAVGRIATIDRPARPGAVADADWCWQVAVPSLASALLSVEQPFVLVLDDAHRLAEDAGEVVTALVRHVPHGSTVALVGRGEALRSLPRLRVSGDLIELGTEDLAFTRRETRALLQTIGVRVPASRLDDLLCRTEGWAAALRLAALSIRVQEAGTVGGQDQEGALEEYLRAEHLAALTRRQRDFLVRTSMLERMCAPLCDAVLRRRDSSRVIESLESSSLLVPLDRRGEWFRCHRALREQLRTELTGREPWLEQTLERRAAGWLMARDDLEGALGHLHAAGDVDRFAMILEGVADQIHNRGEDSTLLHWIGRLEDLAELEEYPAIAAIAARLHAQQGNATEAGRCLSAAVRSAADGFPDGEGLLNARIGLVRAATCPDGVESMLADVESVVDDLPRHDWWRPWALLLQGTAYALLDEVERADAILSRAVHAAERLNSTETRVLALTERSLLASARGERLEADSLLERARAAVDEWNLGGYGTCALTAAAWARSLLLHGQAARARSYMASAHDLCRSLNGGLPWLAVQTRLELIRAHVTLRDSTAARGLLAEIDDLLAARPELGVLRRERNLVEAELDSMPVKNGESRAPGLTDAELRLLPMLATHLSFREIGARFYLSRNTVKTQAISVYRKLGATSRSQAVDQAGRLGLINRVASEGGLIPNG